MCTLLVWKHQHPRFGLIAAANRDEFLARPATGATRLAVDPHVVGGLDLMAGGSWFAVNELGLLAALTNRHGAGKHDPTKRSRGRLVAEIARHRTVAGAEAAIARIDARAYNPFVLLIAGADDALAVHGGENGAHIVHLTDGAHAITNWDLDAAVPSKAAYALGKASTSSVGSDDAADLARKLHAMLADHGSGSGDDALCVHRPQRGYGTRSTSIALIGSAPGDMRLFHAEGPACTSTLVEVSGLLRDEGAKRMSNPDGR